MSCTQTWVCFWCFQMSNITPNHTSIFQISFHIAKLSVKQSLMPLRVVAQCSHSDVETWFQSPEGFVRFNWLMDRKVTGFTSCRLVWSGGVGGMRLAAADAAAAGRHVGGCEPSGISHHRWQPVPPPPVGAAGSASERRSKPQDGCFQGLGSVEAAAVCRRAAQETRTQAEGKPQCRATIIRSWRLPKPDDLTSCIIYLRLICEIQKKNLGLVQACTTYGPGAICGSVNILSGPPNLKKWY